MGVQLRDILPKSETTIEALKGRKLAVDALNTIYQFLSTIRQKDGTPLMDSRGRVTSHLSGIFYRNARLLENGVTPIYVFDGKPDALKGRTLGEREAAKVIARTKYEEAIAKGLETEARKYAQQTSKVTDEMLTDAKRLLSAMGIAWVQAPSEGEAQAAHMCAKGVVYTVASQDYDSLLFGAPRLLRNLNITGKRKLPGKELFIDVVPEMIELSEVLQNLKVTREQLVAIGMLVGTDYNPDGVKGIGPKKALDLVRGKKFDEIFAKVQWTGPPVDEVADIFLKPQVTDDYRTEAGELNESELYQLLSSEHDFGEERVKKVLDTIKENKDKGRQQSLERFF